MSEVEFSTPWSTNNKKDTDSFHPLCSYLGAFPPALANYFIKYFTDKDDIVFDPFSGRGTTLLESRILDRNSIASDLNPIALSISRAKSHDLNVNDIFTRIDDLKNNYDYALFMPEANAQMDDIHLIYHPRTLAQLCYLRLVLINSKNKVDEYLIGAILGIMHGGEAKDGKSNYASISMPNTFSMSPEYVRRFVQTKQLNREFRDVFDILKKKTIRVFEKHQPSNKESIVVRGDAKEISKNKALKEYISNVSLILTSPPYLGVVNYAKQNWIRSWFLNEDPSNVSNDLDDDLNLIEWISFSKKTLLEFKKFLKPDGVAILVIGDVAKSKNSVIPLAREFVSMVKENEIFKNIWVFSDYIKDSNKTTKIWGNGKGKATKIDRIVILSDINPFKNNVRLNGELKLTYDIIQKSTKKFLVSDL